MIGAQLLLPGAAPPPDLPGLAARRTRPVMVAVPQAYDAILAAPIFAPDRRPGASGGASDTGGGTLAAYAALGSATGRTVATGVISTPGGAIKTLRVGDEVEGWRLVGVGKTRLTFERNGVRHDLAVGAPAEGATPVPNGADASTQEVTEQ